MDLNKFSLIVTSTIAVAAIISPTLVAAINAYFELKRYKLEIHERNRYDLKLKTNVLFEEYCQSIGKLIGNDTSGIYDPREIGTYKTLMFRFLPYATDQLRSSINELDSLVNNKQFKQVQQSMLKVIDLYKAYQVPAIK
jgi:hypothetical protein